MIIVENYDFFLVMCNNAGIKSPWKQEKTPRTRYACTRRFLSAFFERVFIIPLFQQHFSGAYSGSVAAANVKQIHASRQMLAFEFQMIA